MKNGFYLNPGVDAELQSGSKFFCALFRARLYQAYSLMFGQSRCLPKALPWAELSQAFSLFGGLLKICP